MDHACAELAVGQSAKPQPVNQAAQPNNLTMAHKVLLSLDGQTLTYEELRREIKKVYRVEPTQTLDRMLDKRVARDSFFYKTADGHYGLLDHKKAKFEAEMQRSRLDVYLAGPPKEVPVPELSVPQQMLGLLAALLLLCMALVGVAGIVAILVGFVSFAAAASPVVLLLFLILCVISSK
jgi:hypothetical protein